jgi:hypothetical protein
MTGARAADLVRDVGLMADGPVRWGRPAPARGPGIYLVELALPLASAPIELTRVGKWLERVPALLGSPAWDAQPEHVVSVMDGRSVWPDDFEAARDIIARIPAGQPLRLVPSTSLMFLPVTVEGEELPPGFEFAREKARRLARWAEALRSGTEPAAEASPPVATWPVVGELTERAPQAFRGILDRRPRAGVGRRVRGAPVRGARCEEGGFVREVAVDGRPADAGVLRDRADRRPSGADRPVQGDRALGDPQAGAGLELGAALHPVWSFFVSHHCSINN